MICPPPLSSPWSRSRRRCSLLLSPRPTARLQRSPEGPVDPNHNPNKSAFSYLRTPTTRHCPHSPATRRCCSTRPISPAGPQQQNQPHAAAVSGRTGQTGGQTDRRPYRFIDSVAYYASSVNNNPNEGQMSATVISGGRCRAKGANVVGGALRTFRRHSASSTPHGSRASQTDAVHALYIAATTAPSSFQLQQEREID